MPATTPAERIAALAYDYAAEPKEDPSACNLCGAKGCAEPLARRDRYGFSATLVACRRCGLAYLAPRLTAASYADFYGRVYRPLVSAHHGRRIDAETVQDEQREDAAALAAFLLPRLASPPASIIDVGGSTGVVAGVLAARTGSRASILDPAPDELAVARAAGMETIDGLAEDFDPAGRQWDLVLLCQTIDHLLDVRATLGALRRMTADGGRVFVDILDADLMLERTGSIERVAKIDHPYSLTRATVAAYFTLAGFTIVGERTTADGHRGFVLAPGASLEPDWSRLESGAAEFLARVRAVGTA